MNKLNSVVLYSGIVLAGILAIFYAIVMFWLGDNVVTACFVLVSLWFSLSGALIVFDDEHLIRRDKQKSLMLMKLYTVLAFPIFIAPIEANRLLTAKSAATRFGFILLYVLLVIVFYLTLIAHAFCLEEEIDRLKCANQIYETLDQDSDRKNRLIFSQYTDDEKEYVEQEHIQNLHPLCRKEFLLSFGYCYWLANRYDCKYQLWFNNHI